MLRHFRWGIHSFHPPADGKLFRLQQCVDRLLRQPLQIAVYLAAGVLIEPPQAAGVAPLLRHSGLRTQLSNRTGDGGPADGIAVPCQKQGTASPPAPRAAAEGTLPA